MASMFHHTITFQDFGGSPSKRRKVYKSMQIEKEERKLSLFSGDINYMKNSKELTKMFESNKRSYQ